MLQRPLYNRLAFKFARRLLNTGRHEMDSRIGGSETTVFQSRTCEVNGYR